MPDVLAREFDEVDQILLSQKKIIHVLIAVIAVMIIGLVIYGMSVRVREE